MAAYVLQHAHDCADKTALSIIGAGTSHDYSYAQITNAVRGGATGLLALGLKADDRVIIRLGNTADVPITYLACIAVGLIPVPLSQQLTAPEVAKIGATIQPALTIQSDDMPAASRHILHQNALAALYENAPADYVMGDPNRPAYIIHTSGTSGQPRGVIHAHRAVWARQMMWDGWYDLKPTDRLMHAGAFNWTYTLGTGLMDPWAIGATALIPASGTDAATLPALMAAHRATIFAAAPGVYRRALRGPIPALPDLRHGLSAGEKLPSETAIKWHRTTGTLIHEAFGMSECSTFISGSPKRPAPIQASGYAQACRNVAIIQNGSPVQTNDIGMIAIHRSDKGLMLGYLNARDETAAKYDGDWFMTGDMGRMDADGAVTYAGRGDDMMNAGGYRVSPIEVEDALAAHPDIHEAAAAEVTIKQGVCVIAGFYVSENMIDDATLAAFCADQIAGYKCPRLFVRVETLPRGANNKLLRRVLRQNWETTHGQA